MKLIDGKNIAENIYKELQEQLPNISHRRLVVVLASEDEASLRYVRLKRKKAAELGIDVEIIEMLNEQDAGKVIDVITELNVQADVGGILVQLPMNESLEPRRSDVVNAISPEKDVDGLTAMTLGRLAQNAPAAIMPATVAAVMEAIRFTGATLTGAHVVVVNHSTLVGRPLASALLNQNATVSVAHEHTQDLGSITRQADIIVTATGQVGLVKGDMIKDSAIVIDVTSKAVDGKVMGDVEVTPELESKVLWLTPVPGGIGPLTIACLLRNFVQLNSE